MVGELGMGPAGTVQSLRGGAVDDPAANRVGQDVGDGRPTTGSLTAAQSCQALVQVGLGGGIDCENSVLSLTGCTVNANQANGTTALGGGIYAVDSTVDIANSVVNGNQANGSVLGEGGGINSSNSSLALRKSIVKGNKATTSFNDIFGPRDFPVVGRCLEPW